MRGKVYFENKYRHVKRITPAYAGKSLRKQGKQRYFEDHPRLCGEKVQICIFQQFRGGITPAYAGKRQGKIRRCAVREDHPRLCGEKTKKIPKQRNFFHQPASFSFSLQYT